MLSKSLHQQIPIVLGLKTLPDAVALPSNLELFTDRSRQSLPPGTQIIELFDDIGEGIRTMLILGQPGAGKTIALLQLAQVLLGRAEKDVHQRIPVVLNLPSWAQEKKPIADWIVQELHSLYSVSRSIGKAWIKQQELLLLLDGLDEIRNESDREACVQAINIFQQQHLTEIVICCRIRDYKVLKNQLRFRKAIYLKNLSRSQIETYLTQLGAKASGLKTLLAHDTELQKLARSPLMLNIMVLTYEGIAAEDIPETSLTSSRTQQLFDAYIDRMFCGSKQFAHQILPAHRQIQQQEPYSHQQARRWLIWLAKQMVNQSRTVFLIERLQPDLLERSDRIWYRIGVGLFGSLSGLLGGIFMGGLIGVLIGGLGSALLGRLDDLLTSGLRFGQVGALIGGLTGGLWAGLWGGLIGGIKDRLEQIQPVEGLNWSWRRFKNKGLSSGLPIALLSVLWGWLNYGLMFGLTIGLTIGLIIGLLGGLQDGLSSVEVRTRTEPNQGIWRSARNSLIGGLTIGVTAGLIVGLIAGLSNGNGLLFGLLSGLVVGLIIGLGSGLLRYGGQVCIQHFVLRYLLHCRGVMPWNYARFLNWASDRLFLQRVGGGYIFVHRRLMEHFAQMDEGNGRYSRYR